MKLLAARADSWLAAFAARNAAGAHLPPTAQALNTTQLATPAGQVRVYDSATPGACLLFVPDGPNVIEHYAALMAQLAKQFRVVCVDMPGFGRSLPAPHYTHSLDEGASAILSVLDALGLDKVTLAFSCANGFYAMRVAKRAPHRVAGLVLTQTPSLAAMHAWTARTVPWPLGVPVVGQVTGWLLRRKAALRWYRAALPKGVDAQTLHHLRATAHAALDHGGCFCLAGVVQGLLREDPSLIDGVNTPCLMIWGTLDRSHSATDPASLRSHLPQAQIVRFDDCGHFPDVEQSARYAQVLMQWLEPPSGGAACPDNYAQPLLVPNLRD